MRFFTALLLLMLCGKIGAQCTDTLDLSVGGSVCSGNQFAYHGGMYSAGTYNLFFEGAGLECDSAITLTVTQVAPPAATLITDGQITCTDNCVDLIASPAGLSYNWGSGFVTSNQETTCAIGAYTVTVANATGCTATASATVTGSTTPPMLQVISDAGTNITCTNSCINLAATSSNGATIDWTAQSCVTAGTYTAVATLNGCTVSSAITITQSEFPPTAVLTSSTSQLTCVVTSATLTATPAIGMTYQWSAGATSVSGTSSATIAAAGTFTVTVTSVANGCTSTSAVLVTQGATPPTAGLTTSAGQLNCTTTSATLTATPATGMTYQWSAGATVVPGTNTATVAAAGTFTVTVTSIANGCTSTATVAITQSLSAGLTSTASELTCVVTSATLTATPSTGVTYQWSAGATSVSGTNSATVSSAGAFTVTVTSTANGCSSTASVVITLSWADPIGELIPNNSQLSCTTSSITLMAIPATGTIYNWSSGVSPIAGTNTATVSMPGTYTVTLTNFFSGCTTTASVVITQSTTPPTVGLTSAPSQITCATPWTTLTATPATGMTYNWTQGATAMSGTNMATVASAGTFTVTVTSVANGCTSTASVFISQSFNPPFVSLTSTTTQLTCTTSSATITALPSGMNYNWSSNLMPIAGTNTATVTSQGTFTVTVTNPANGCWGTASISIIASGTPPLISPSQIGALSCLNTSVSLNSNATPAQSYLWSTGETTPNINISAPGTYTVTAYNGTCPSSASIVVVDNISSINIASSGILNCASQTVQLIATSIAGAIYTWSGGTATSNQTLVTEAGIYTVSATNGTCTETASFEVVADLMPPMLTCIVENGCGFAMLQASSDSPSNIFNWSSGQNGPMLTVNASGTYCVTVTGMNGCTSETCVVVNVPPTLAAYILNESTGCGTADLTPTGFGGTPTYSYQWSGNISGQPPVYQAELPGVYTVTVIDIMGCTATATTEVIYVPSDSCTALDGYVYLDADENCLEDVPMQGLNGFMITAENTATGDLCYAVTNAEGYYFMALEPGDYVITVGTSDAWALCEPDYAINIPATEQVNTLNIPVQSTECLEWEIDISNFILRPCFQNNYFYITYENMGSVTAQNAVVSVQLDPALTILNITMPYTSEGGGLYTFAVGDVDPLGFGFIFITCSLDCNIPLGVTLCNTATITSDTDCLPASPLWSGASLTMSSICEGDSLRFDIVNDGIADMTAPLEYTIIEDGIMMLQAPQDPLAVGETYTVRVPANGATWLVTAEQEPFHPYPSPVSEVIEGCTVGGSFSTGFVNMFPPDDEAENTDEDCTTTTASYDPNDKQGFPIGYADPHYILPGTDIEYLIRFQNTGTDTAFNVVIRDTLSQWLDPATFRMGSSSHTCMADLSGAGNLAFHFNNIMLPDSNVNEPASHGFLSFRISQRDSLELPTVIENTAAIYFDFNAPIITNTTLHTVAVDFIVVRTDAANSFQTTVQPNPLTSGATFVLPDGFDGSFDLFSAIGKHLRQARVAGNQFAFERGDLPAGTYFFRFAGNDGRTASGSLVIR